MQKRNALIAGASGLVGSSLLRQLLENDQYEKILVLTRKPVDISNPKLIQRQIDFDQLESFRTEIRIDDVFCALGTTIKTAGSKDAFCKVDHDYVLSLGNWSADNAVQRFLVVSAMGADTGSWVFYNRVKGKMEKSVSRLNIPQIQVFRPSLLMGNRNEKRGGEKIAQVVFGGLGFLFAGPLLKYKGIQADVVAGTMIRAAAKEDKGFRVFDSGECRGCKR